MSALIIILHIVVCLILILSILLQSGKAADLAGAFGGGGSQTAFGGRGSTSLLSKLTTGAAILFMITSLGLWILSGRQGSSVVGREKAPATSTKPATKPADKAGTEQKAAQPAAKTDQQQPPAAGGTAEKK
jgi:preprotein translocase subunit SecG